MPKWADRNPVISATMGSAGEGVAAARGGGHSRRRLPERLRFLDRGR